MLLPYDEITVEQSSTWNELVKFTSKQIPFAPGENHQSFKMKVREQVLKNNYPHLKEFTIIVSGFTSQIFINNDTFLSLMKNMSNIYDVRMIENTSNITGKCSCAIITRREIHDLINELELILASCFPTLELYVDAMPELLLPKAMKQEFLTKNAPEIYEDKSNIFVLKRNVEEHVKHTKERDTNSIIEHPPVSPNPK